MWDGKTLDEYGRRLAEDELGERRRDVLPEANNVIAIRSSNTNSTEFESSGLHESTWDEVSARIYVTEFILIEDYSTDEKYSDEECSYTNSESSRLRERIEMQSEQMDLMLCNEFLHESSLHESINEDENSQYDSINENEYLKLKLLFESERQLQAQSPMRTCCSEVFFCLVMPFIGILLTTFIFYFV